MGAGNSTSNTQVINTTEYNIDQSVENNIQQNCNSQQMQTNLMQIIGSSVNNLTAEQSNIAKNLCVLQTMIESTRDAGASQELMNKITEKIQSSGGLPGTGGNSESNTLMYNNLAATIDQSTLNNVTRDCILQQEQRNVLQILASDVNNSNLSQVNDAFSECIQTSEEYQAVKATVDNKTKNDLDKSVTSSGMKMDSSASLVSLGLPLIICCFVMSSIILSSNMMGKGGGGGGSGSGTGSGSGPSIIGLATQVAKIAK